MYNPSKTNNLESFKEIGEETLNQISGGWVTYHTNIATYTEGVVATDGIVAAEVAGVGAVIAVPAVVV